MATSEGSGPANGLDEWVVEEPGEEGHDMAVTCGVAARVRVGDAEHPMDITMSRVRLASDSCNIYFAYTKVNHLLYTCSLDPFEDGILLDTSPVCMHRYSWSFTDDEEEFKRQGITTPSEREAWKRRRKKTELLKLQRPDIRAKGRTSGACAAAKELHQQTANSISGRTSGPSP